MSNYASVSKHYTLPTRHMTATDLQLSPTRIIRIFQRFFKSIVIHIKPTFLVNKRATHVKNVLLLGDVVNGLIIVIVQGKAGQVVLPPAGISKPTVSDLEGGTGLGGGPDKLIDTVLRLVEEGGTRQTGFGLVADKGDDGGAVVLLVTEVSVVVG